MKDNPIIALAGNPNTGKSTLFNALTGLNQHTGNWPGKTVTNAIGKFEYQGRTYTLVDLPGTYSLMANTIEEEIARDYLCTENPDAVVIVTDATCLERNLNLVLQIMAITDKVIVCVNLIDEAKRKGIHLDLAKLADLLGVPVIGTVANTGAGLDNLKSTIALMVAGEISTKPRKIISANPQETDDNHDQIVSAIMATAEEISHQVITVTHPDPHQFDRKIDRILTSRIFGIPIMLTLLGLVFWITIVGANYPSTLLQEGFSWLEGQLFDFFVWIGVPDSIRDLLILGVYRTVAWVVSVMLPPMSIFFPLFTLLEDLGYLPRIAFNLDSFFKKACAHGKQALTMCMGFGCNAAGVTACRIIDSPRERLIAIITNNFVPCNGRFPTLIALATIFIVPTVKYSSIAAAGIILAAIILAVAITLGVSFILSKTILKGLPSAFILEMPPYRKPQVGRIIIRSIFDRTLFVLGRAVMVAMPAGLIIWILANTNISGQSLLAYGAQFLDPFARLLGLDGYILIAFILGLPANEIVIPIVIMSYMAEGTLIELASLTELWELLVQNGWTWLTALCTMLFSLNHWPCGTTLWTIKKETLSWKWTWISLITPTVVGIVLCLIVAQGSRLLGLI